MDIQMNNIIYTSYISNIAYPSHTSDNIYNFFISREKNVSLIIRSLAFIWRQSYQSFFLFNLCILDE